jgi:hypothetical protein
MTLEPGPRRRAARTAPPHALALALVLLACGGDPKAITGCSEADGVTPICGFTNPEDLAPIPGGSWLVVSQYAGMQGGSGSLVAWRAADDRRITLFPDPEALAGEAPPWGSSDCPGPPDPARFAPHGIDVDPRTHRLAVVNHGDREAVELFELRHTSRGPAVRYRGCVPIPDDALANDVALLADGGLVLTRMFPRGRVATLVSFARMLAGFTTGWVLEWSPERGWSDVPDSEGAAPNGIAVSQDGRDIFFAEWSGSRLVRLRRSADGGVERSQIELPHHPDNLTWTRDGRLLVTGQVGPLGALLACGDTPNGTCALPFSVLVVEPSTLDAKPVLEHPGTAQGAGTVALEMGGELYLGTFDGDRLGRAPYRP